MGLKVLFLKLGVKSSVLVFGKILKQKLFFKFGYIRKIYLWKYTRNFSRLEPQSSIYQNIRKICFFWKNIRVLSELIFLKLFFELGLRNDSGSLRINY